MYCPKCKKEQKENVLYCPECGTKTVPGRRCRTCGEFLKEDMAFCPECGTPADGQEEPKKTQRQEQPKKILQQEQPKKTLLQEQPPKKKLPTVAAAGAAALLTAAVIAAIIFLKQPDPEAEPEEPNSVQVIAEEKTQEKETEKTEKTEVIVPKEDSDKASEQKQEKKTEEKEKKEESAGVVSVIGSDAPQEKPAEPAEAEAPRTLAGAKEKSAQQAVLTAGGRLDLVHMGNLLANAGAAYGSYVLDLTNLQEYDAGNADGALPASALIGVPILFTIADGVDKGEILLDTPVTFRYTFENGRGIFRSSDSGRTFPVSQMLSEALLNSDNNALNSLIDFLTLERINNTCHSYGFSSVDMQRKLVSESTNLENYLSAKDAAMMLNAVYQDNFTGIGKAFLEMNFKIAGADTANRGMYPAASSCETFLNLNGITDSRYNEIGLIQNGEQVFILSVFTCNGDGDVSASALTTLTSYVLGIMK